MDRPTRAANEAAVLGWDYDGPSGVLTSTTQQNLAQPGQPVYTTRRIYDATHTRLEQVVYPSGAIVDYGYDDAGRMTSLNHSGTGAYSFTYDARGLPETMTQPGGLVTRWWRDEAGRMIAKKTTRSSDGAVILQTEVGYDEVGNKTFKTTSWDGSSSNVTHSDLYQLDDGSQVVGVRYGVDAARTDTGQISYANKPRPPTDYDNASQWAREEAWKFDGLGNREWMTVRPGNGASSATTAYSADIMNRYDSVDGQNYQHDTDGRLTNDGQFIYAWTGEGRLKEVRKGSDNSVVVQYTYDALGRRISRYLVAANQTTWYIWDGSHVIEERDDSGQLTAQYLWGPGEQLLAGYEGASYAIWTQAILDDLNSVAALAFVDSSGAEIVARYRYSIYGEPHRVDESGNDLTPGSESEFVHALYNGQFWESELGLNMYRERWMSPALGRFISPSALTYPVAELNYLFCFNNPVSFIDINGLWPTGAELAGRWDGFVDNSVIGQESSGSFLGDFVKYGLGEALKLPADVARLGQGAAIAYEGNDFAGNCLSFWERGLYGASDLGRATALAGGMGGAIKGIGAGARGLRGLRNGLKAVEGTKAVKSGSNIGDLIERLGESAAKAPPWKIGANKSASKIASQMQQRGWTADQITEAITSGQRFPATNLVNKANSATRYVHPTTGRSVVVDDVTQEVIHVGGDGFLY